MLLKSPGKFLVYDYLMKDLIIKSLKDPNLIAVFVIAICYNYLYDIADPDFWSRLYCGAAYLKNGWVYYQDIFSFVETKSIWVDHEWLSGVIYFLLLKYIGPCGILFLKWFCIILEMWLIYLCIRQRCDVNVNILFLVIVLFALEPAFVSNIRPHNFTYIFFTFWLLILDHSRINNTTKYLWILPLTIPLWVNLHAGCISGIALAGVFMVSQIIEKKNFKPYLYLIPASTVLMLLNPYTYHYFDYVIAELTSTHDSIVEWDPVVVLSYTEFLFFKALIILTLIAFAFSKDQKMDPVGFILLLVFAYFGFKHARHNILFAIAAGIFIYERLVNIYLRLKEAHLKKRSERSAQRIEFMGGVAFSIFAIILFIPTIITLKPLSWNFTVPENEYPVNCVQFIKQNNLKGNMVLPFMWGGYVTWLLYPNIMVSIDGRHVEIFSLDVFHKNNDFYFARKDWEKMLEDYEVDILLLDWRKSPVYKKMLEDKNWKEVYKDARSAVMVRATNSDKINALKKTHRKLTSEIDHLDSYFLKDSFFH